MKRYFEIFFLSLGVHLVYSQELANVPVKLSTLASKLHYDKDIQENVNRLARDGQQVDTSFKHMLQTEGSKILTETNRLAKTSNSADVKVDILQNTLKRAKDSLITEQKDIQALEIDVHVSIEECQSRKTDHVMKQRSTNLKLEALPTEIASLDQQIKAHDESVGTLEQSARDLDNQAKNLRRVARDKRDDGIFGGVIGTILGVALAPFTGGASLAIATAAAGVHLGINLNDAEDCNRNARRFREEAVSKRTQAQSLRSKRDSFEAEKRRLQNEINLLKTSSDELQQAATGLQDVSGYLRTSLVVIDNLLQAIQNMDTAMRDAELASNAFVIIQSAFIRGSSVTLDAKSKVYLDKLKEKWTRLESTLLQYGAKPALT